MRNPANSMLELRSLLGEAFDASQYKLHAARRSRDGVDPLAVYGAGDWVGWVGWNRWRENKNDFTRPCIFSMMQVEPGSHHWVFGGAFRITDRHGDIRQGVGYDVELVGGLLESLVGRLNIRWKPPVRGRAFLMERCLDQMSVTDIAALPWAGVEFPGMDSINHSFRELEVILRAGRADWRNVLDQMKGVYVWNDLSTGFAYIGSATSETGGLWSRLGSYIDTGDAGNQGLRDLVAERGIEHVRANFQFALLEYWPMRKDDNDILKREAYWKDVFQTRERGYNRN